MSTVNINVSLEKVKNADCPECGNSENNYDVIVDVRGTKEPKIAPQTIKCEKCDHSYETQTMIIEKEFVD